MGESKISDNHGYTSQLHKLRYGYSNVIKNAGHARQIRPFSLNIKYVSCKERTLNAILLRKGKTTKRIIVLSMVLSLVKRLHTKKHYGRNILKQRFH